MNFKNLTPHPINLGELTIPSEGIVRVNQEEVILSENPRIVNVEYGVITGLPENVSKNENLIVSVFVVVPLKEAGFKNIFTPNTGPTENGAIRDENGRIKGVKSLIKH